MTNRYFLAGLQAGETVLEGPEAHHLLHVMRAGVGAEIELFDGQGRCATAKVIGCRRRQAVLQVSQPAPAGPPPGPPLWIGVALPKGERQKWLVEKAVELGVTKLTPLIVERGVAEPTDSALQRLRRTVVEACKQCGRNQLMLVDSPLESADFWPAASSDCAKWVADPAGGPLSWPLPAAGLAAAVGPEGGFTDSELVAAQQCDWHLISLGPRVLRVETAALALAAAAGIRG